MTGGLTEAIGGVIDGGLVARAVEPAAGEGRGHTHEGHCLNCGADLVGPFCHRCGQRAHVHRTLGAFLHDFVHGVFHLEGKTWRTIPMLAWKPGKLTREYIDGRRASYVSPIALFLFVTFLMFAVFHAIGGPLRLSDVTVNGKKQSFEQAEQAIGADIAQQQAQRKAAVTAGQPTAAIDKEIAADQQSLATVRSFHAGDLKAVAAITGNPATISSSNAINRMWQRAKTNPDLLVYELQSNAYKYSWLLIVISVPFVWLLFAWDRRFGLYDHTVFVTYSLSFMMLALTIASVGAAMGVGLLVAVPVLYAPFHMYRQLRGTYGTGRFGALVRTSLLLVFALIAITLWAAALVGMLFE